MKLRLLSMRRLWRGERPFKKLRGASQLCSATVSESYKLELYRTHSEYVGRRAPRYARHNQRYIQPL
eukprot:1724706-Amphidinium_carterae.1